MFRRLHSRFAALYAVLVLAGLLALGTATAVALSWEERNLEAKRAITDAVLIAEGAAPLLAVDPVDPAARPSLRQFAERAARATDDRVTIIALDGTVLADTEADPSTMKNHLDRPEVREALQHEQGTSARYSTTVERDVLYAVVVARHQGTPVGIVRLATRPPSLFVAHAPVLTTVATVGTVMGLVTIAVAVVVGRATTAPVRRLTRAARRLAAGQLDQRVETGRTDEIGQLAIAFNRMAARLREQIATIAAERNRATAVLANMTDGIVLVDHTLHVERLNAAAGQLLGLRDTSLVGRSIAEVVRDHELQQVLRAALAQNAPATAAVRLAPLPSAGSGTDAHEPRTVQVTGIPIPEQQADGTAGLLVLHDITELRRAELIRREFVANVSHELRTPLASLRALVETLEGGALDEPDVARDFLGQMHVEVDSLTQLVEELLELSRIESGQAAIRPEVVTPAGIAHDAARRLRAQAERAGVELVVDVPADLPMVWADPSRLMQVLVNLLHNAVKFTPPGGRITLQTTTRPEGVLFSVTDTGIGIGPQDLGRIFERFYKADRSRASSGTGLGLAIAKHVVQAHRGRIWAESEGLGKGARFAFTAPLAGERASQSPALARPPAPTGVGAAHARSDRTRR